MKQLRLAIIGVGPVRETRSSRHLRLIKKLSDMYTLCALCDTDEKRLREAGEDFDVKACYTDLDDMLRQEKPDVVYRLTPKDSITPLNLRIANSGTHLITEIPIGLTLPTTDLVIEACRRNNVKMEIAENVWVWPEEQLKAKIARAGLLGKITHARLMYPCGSYHGFSTTRKIIGAEPLRVLGYEAEIDMRERKVHSGAMESRTFWEAGVFEFPDQVRLLYEQPPKGRTTNRRQWDVEGTHGYLSGHVLVLYENGKEVSYPFEHEYEEIRGLQTLSGLRVNTDPPVVWENPFKQWHVGSTEGGSDHGIPGRDDIAKAHILASMYYALTEGRELAYGPVNARRDLEMWVAVCESARKGNVWIDFPLTEITGIERQIHESFRERYNHDPIENIDEIYNVSFPRGGVLWDVAGWL